MQKQMSVTLQAFLQMVESGDFAILSLESTGIFSGEVCQVALIDAQGTPLLNTIVNPPTQRITHDGTLIHGITDEVAAQHGEQWAYVQPELVRLLERTMRVFMFDANRTLRSLVNTDLGADIHPRAYSSMTDIYCAKAAYEEFMGDWNAVNQCYHRKSLEDAVWELNLTSSFETGSTALEDCLRTLAVVREMAGIR